MSYSNLTRRVAALLCSVSLLTAGVAQTAAGAMIGTAQQLAQEQRVEQLQRVGSVLSRGDVQQQLTLMGVSPDEASARVQALSDADLAELDARLGELPAGEGVLVVAGVVLVVLLILELVGVIDIFKKL